MKDKNRYGQYFTVDSIAEFMVGLVRHDKRCRVLEPSCGKGVFLHKLLAAGFDRIDAYEIDPAIGNPFDFVRYGSFISSPLDEYDVVIGNPPYIRWKNLEQELKDELASSRLWNKYFNSLCDYLFIFILKSIEQLAEGGELIFICTEYWMNTTHSASLRNYMVRNGYFSEIYHFKEAPLFEGVCASFIIFRYIKTRGEKHDAVSLFKYKGTGGPSLEGLTNLSCFSHVAIPQFEENKRWLLATSEQQERMETFEGRCRTDGVDLFSTPCVKRIGDFCDIGNGMVSGLDKAFNVTGLNLTPKEAAATIAVLKAKDLDYYSYHSESKYFFIREEVSEDRFKEEYAHVYDHMRDYIEDLGKRYDYGKAIKYWEFVFPRNYRLFSRPEKRILVPCKERISNKNHFRFVLADASYYPLQDVTAILRKDCCKESVEYLLAYLNNERVFEWLCFNGIVKGYIVEFSEAPVASIPYRTINWDDEREREIHHVITSAVRDYLDTKDEKYIALINDCFNHLFL